MKSEHPNLAWMAQHDYSKEFVAMITAVEKWAHQKPKPDWNHPFPLLRMHWRKRQAGEYCRPILI
jgi:hypothetical protein